MAGIDLPPRFDAVAGLYDLRAMRDLRALQDAWLRPAIDAVRAGHLPALRLDAEDGARWTLAHGQRWRFWRKPLPAIDA